MELPERRCQASRPIRSKMHELVDGTLQRLCRVLERMSAYFARRKGLTARQYENRIEEQFGDHCVRCPNCGSTAMQLIPVWSQSEGLVYDAVRDDPSLSAPAVFIPVQNPALSVRTAQAVGPVQLEFAFLRGLLPRRHGGTEKRRREIGGFIASTGGRQTKQCLASVHPRRGKTHRWFLRWRQTEQKGAGP